MKHTIQQLAAELGFDACGITSAAPPATGSQLQQWLATGRHGEMGYLARNSQKRTDPQLVLPGARTIISLATSYAREETRHPPSLPPPATLASAAGTERKQLGSITGSQGVVARYARFTDYHDVIGERLKTFTARIHELAGPQERSLWYVDTGPLLERDLAQRAGVGFIGKHTNLISRKLGNWFFLAEILTTQELEPDTPEHNRCGSCTRCLDACPTGAITAPFQLDARRCISYLTIELKGSIPLEFRPAIGDRIYGCDDCLAACPWNRFAQAGRLLRGHARPDLAAPDLLELLALDEAGFKRHFSGTPMLRTKRRGLLRNVCVALGNIGDGRSLPALQTAALDPEPLIAEHARWAMQRIAERTAAPE